MENSKKVVLITGTSRGIGLELTNKCKDIYKTVIAACREPSKELEEICIKSKNVLICPQIDVSYPKCGIDMVAFLNKNNIDHIDILFNNAGILARENFDDIHFNGMEKQFLVNAIAPLRITQEFVKSHLLSKHSIVVLFSSVLASIKNNEGGNLYGYRMSKAALNMAGKTLAVDLAAKKIGILIIHPGYVSTDMTEHKGNITTEVACNNILETIEKFTLDDSGIFIDTTNQKMLPW